MCYLKKNENKNNQIIIIMMPGNLLKRGGGGWKHFGPSFLIVSTCRSFRHGHFLHAIVLACEENVLWRYGGASWWFSSQPAKYSGVKKVTTRIMRFYMREACKTGWLCLLLSYFLIFDWLYWAIYLLRYCKTNDFFTLWRSRGMKKKN